MTRRSPAGLGPQEYLRTLHGFAGVERILAEVNAAVVEQATDLRARYNLKTPDALHYATAVQVGATVFLTGDRGLVRCTEVPVGVL